jgi:hypothetical protein
MLQVLLPAEQGLLGFGQLGHRGHLREVGLGRQGHGLGLVLVLGQ